MMTLDELMLNAGFTRKLGREGVVFDVTKFPILKNIMTSQSQCIHDEGRVNDARLAK